MKNYHTFEVSLGKFIFLRCLLAKIISFKCHVAILHFDSMVRSLQVFNIYGLQYIFCQVMNLR